MNKNRTDKIFMKKIAGNGQKSSLENHLRLRFMRLSIYRSVRMHIYTGVRES